MPRRLISEVEREQLEELVELCFTLEQDLERREALSAQYDLVETVAEEIDQLSKVKTELRALLEKVLQRLP